MNKTHRRAFMLQVGATGSALPAASRAIAQAGGPKLEETDAQAVALGYKRDTTKVDAAKYPKHATTQTCGTCQCTKARAKTRSAVARSLQASRWRSADGAVRGSRRPEGRSAGRPPRRIFGPAICQAEPSWLT
jgi:hypothetical protein